MKRVVSLPEIQYKCLFRALELKFKKEHGLKVSLYFRSYEKDDGIKTIYFALLTESTDELPAYDFALTDAKPTASTSTST